MDGFSAPASYLDGEDDLALLVPPPPRASVGDTPSSDAASVPAGSARWWQGVPSSALPDTGVEAALDGLGRAYSQRPHLPEPKWWQRALAGAAGGLAGWSNAAGRTRTPIDIGAMGQNILAPGYGEAMTRWQQNMLAPARTRAEIESAKQSAWWKSQQLEAQAEMNRGRAAYWRHRAELDQTPDGGSAAPVASPDAVPGVPAPPPVGAPSAPAVPMADGGVVPARAKAKQQVERVSEATPDPPTAAVPTEPESPETIAIQTQQLALGGRAAVMLPKGTAAPDVYPPGTSVTADQFGNIYLFRPDLTSGAEIRKAAKNDELPQVLGSADPAAGGGRVGMGTVDKSKLAGDPVAVVADAADGTEVQATATDGKHLPATLAATRKLTPKRGRVSVTKTAPVVISRRQSALARMSRPRPLADLAQPLALKTS